MRILPDLKIDLLYFPLFFLLYLISCGFQDLFSLPVLESKLQLPEMVFMTGTVLYIFKHKGLKSLLNIKSQYNHWYFAVAIWILAHLISFLLYPNKDGFLEFLGSLYLFVVAFIFVHYFQHYSSSVLRDLLVQSFHSLGWIMSLSALIGYLCSIFIVPNFTAQVFYDYPYFGSVFRLQGFTSTPAMYISIITLSIGFTLYAYFFCGRKSSLLFSALIFSLIALLSYSKSILFIALIWICIYAYSKSIPKPYLLVIFALFVFIHLFLSHFLIVDHQKLNTQNFIHSPYTSNEIIVSGNQWSIVGSGYYSFKKAALHLFSKNPAFGIGPGNYNRAIEGLKSEGLYPAHLPNYDPHSMITGTLAGLGIMGFIALAIMWTALFIELNKKHKMPDSFSFVLLLILGIAWAEGCSMDIMNFRHYWICFAIIVAYHPEICRDKKMEIKSL